MFPQILICQIFVLKPNNTKKNRVNLRFLFYIKNLIWFFSIYSQSLNDCTCFICKSFNQENGNKLMECHTCQNLYHQECHDPVITDEEALDPRLIWNCSTCKPVQQTTVINSKINQHLNMKCETGPYFL